MASRGSALDGGKSSAASGQVPLLTIIRHPETVANVAHILQGSTDSPLSVHGEAQLKALCAVVKRAHGNHQPLSSLEEQNKSPLLRHGRRPTHILSSPSGRALQLARALDDALDRGITGGDGGKVCDAGTNPASSSILEVRPDLAERGFGALEGTRKGMHVAGFPRGEGQRESGEIWSRRVQREAHYIFSLLQSRPGTETGRNAAIASTEMNLESHGIHRTLDETRAPHVVVVTHGLWIGMFCSIFVPDRLPFMSNTAILSLAGRSQERLFASDDVESAKVSTHPSASSTAAASMRLTLLAAGDTSHLAGIKRQRGGIGSSVSDKRQRTLQMMWSPPKKK